MSQETELSVLLIEDEPDAARLIQHILAKVADASVTVEWAGDLRTGLRRLQERNFQAVLLDLNLPDSSGFDTFASVRQQAQDRAVIVLTGHEDEALALQAVRAGADEYLMKSEIRDRFLLQRIRHAVERNRQKSMDKEQPVKNGKIFSFVGAKGGVGTSTLALNVAAALARNGKTSLAVELAPAYGSFAALLNRTPIWNLSTVLDGPPERISREAVTSCLEDYAEGFRALCGPQRPQDSRQVSPEQAQLLLTVARSMADFIIVDLPSASAPLLQQVIRNSTLTTLVVERNRLSFQAALAKIKDLQSMAPNPAAVGAVVVNKTTLTEFLSLSEFGRQLRCGLVGMVPPASEMSVAGEFEPLQVLGHPESQFSDSIQELAQRLNSVPIRFLAV